MNNVMKIRSTILLSFLLCMLSAIAQKKMIGVVKDINGKPIDNVNIIMKNSRKSIFTDAKGEFQIVSNNIRDTIEFTKIGYHPLQLFVNLNDKEWYDIQLMALTGNIEEVVINTGYYQLPLERATGSFVHIDTKNLNRGVSTNILDRLEGLSSSVLFDRRNQNGEDASAPEIRVRGISSIDGNKSPLIVLDNFPFDGDINTINPNDVESITILRDAASASIWGARAGNGVIVITTKIGKFNQKPKISYSGIFTSMNKPDLFYSQNYLPAPTVMQIQKELFERNAYQERNQTYLPSYVELLIQKRDNKISESDFFERESQMKSNDIRKEALAHLYQRANIQQNGVNISGGGDSFVYTIASSTNRDRSQVIGNTSARKNLSFQNMFKVNNALNLSSSLWYSTIHQQKNGYTLRDLGYGSSRFIEIYDQLINNDGTPSIVGNNYREAYRESALELGLLDWRFRPLEEKTLVDHTT